MIGKDVPNSKGTSSFRALNTYILSNEESSKRKDKLAYANCVNLLGLSTATVEMEILQHSNRRCKNPVMHTLLSWREEEQPTKEQVDEAVNITLKELGLENCQAVYALHKNTDNYHLHLSINRIDITTFGAITPAGGWTRRAMERAARKIEAAQGWEVEKNAWTRVTNEGFIENLGPQYNKYMPSAGKQKTSDMENLTGEKSAISKAKEIILPIIQEVNSWKEFHKKLSEQGIQYEKNGSGAILHIGEIIIKASSVSRTCSLNSLEKKIGVFERSETRIPNSAKQNIEKIQPIQEAKEYSNWEKYAQERSAYYEEKKNKTTVQKLKRQQEWDMLKKSQKEERDELYKLPKEHRGAFLALRSATAAKQATEKIDLKEKQYKERQQFYKENPTFQSYEEWLRTNGLTKIAASWRYKREINRHNIISPEKSNNEIKLKEVPVLDIRAFKPKISKNEKEILYVFREKENEVGFIDKGKMLQIVKDNDSVTIRAALQLASQKWGSVRLTGTDEFKRRCVEIAAEGNIKIANSELQDAWQQCRNNHKDIEEIRGEKMQEKLELFQQYNRAVGADYYTVSAIEFFENGQNRGFVVNKKDGFPEGFPADMVEKSMPRIAGLGKNGRNIYYTPISEKKHHCLIDDLDGLALAELLAQGYKPATIIESSPGNYQAIITIPKLGTEFDREIGNQIVATLNKEFGDPKVSGEIHAHRAPGFENKKFKHRKADGSFPVVKLIEAKGGECEKTLQLAQKIKTELEHESAKRGELINSIPSSPQNINTVAAYKKHLNDIIRLQKKGGNDKIDASRVDYMVCLRLRVTGHSAEAIESVLVKAAPETRKILQSQGDHNWSDYAKRTVTNVFSFKADRDIEKNKNYIEYWKTLEGSAKKTTREMER